MSKTETNSTAGADGTTGADGTSPLGADEAATGEAATGEATASEAAAAEARAETAEAQAEARDTRELGDATSQLSTAPREESVIGGPTLSVVGWARWFWRQLTSMRIALILLFLLSLAAIPGSLIPQTSSDELKVQTFRDKHTVVSPFYDKLQLFHVYSSVWFSAIYILLFISLIGCIIPRTWQFVGQLRGRPPVAPKRLTRLPAYTTWRTNAEPEAAREAAVAMLRKRHFRVQATGDAVAAEKGYLRETGNLMFHIALIVMLVSFAWGQLFNSNGGKLVVEGDGFANTLTQYDDFKSGSLFDVNNLAPFSFHLDSFSASYETSGPEVGSARAFTAHVTYTAKPGDKPRRSVIELNKPLVVDGSKVYLISHGYAPSVTIKDGHGKTVFHGATPLLPIDSNLSSTGAIKVMDGYRDKNGKKEQLGIAAFFVPTYGQKTGQMFSQFPGLGFPVLNVGPFHGSLGVDSGLPQNVYQLDTSKMTQFKDSKGKQLKKTLLPGETLKLPNGAGSITMDKDIKQWASFQISHQPGSLSALFGACAAIIGLAGSLFIQRRRIWVRATRGTDGVTVIEMAGLGRSESAKLPEELGDLAVTLNSEAPTASEPDPHPAETVEGAEK
jgi:cytochrome c biogenesis protein